MVLLDQTLADLPFGAAAEENTMWHNHTDPPGNRFHRRDHVLDERVIASLRWRHVLFIDAAARFSKGKNQNTMGHADVKAVVEAYRNGVEPDGHGGLDVGLVPFDEIKSNGFDLNIGRYLRPAPEDVADLPAALTAYQAARAARVAAESRMFEVLNAAGIDIGDE